VESSVATANVVSLGKDITFACAHCRSALVVDAAAAGMTLPCQRCGKPTTVPCSPAAGAGAAGTDHPANDKVAELRRQLKENESQRTEVTGYINQLSIQLHRWQLRLQTLEERRKQLENDLLGAR
jgi:transcription elongation factor Elf1